MKFFGKRVCFIGAHPDDIELGCGALIAQISGHADIRCLTLSDNQKNPNLKNLMEEHRRSMASLGIPAEQVLVDSFETRKFQEQRQDILERIFRFNHEFKPDIVFTHTRADIHQDHKTVTEECLRAFRGTTVLGFDVIRSSYGFFPNFLVEVSEADVQKKLTALAEYHTYASKYYFSEEITRATLIRNGALVERHYAEGFETLRIIGAFTPSDLQD
jgi:LmbE family N-acetylglucosaminyl deacetylase